MYIWFKCTGQTENDPLQQFLAARNPKNEHSLTLESLLIKPIQVNELKYMYILLHKSLHY